MHDLYQRLLPISADAGRSDDKNTDRLWYYKLNETRDIRGVWVNKAKIGFVGVPDVLLGYTMHGFFLT